MTTPIPLILFLMFVPFGVAAQNIAMGIALLMILILYLKKKLSPTQLKWQNIKTPTIWLSLFLLSMTFSTFLSDNPRSEPFRFFIGHLPLILLPLLLTKLYDFSNEKICTLVDKIIYYSTLLFALLSITQMIWGWKIEGVSIVDDYPRARGLYSHPLTFAYVLLFYWVYAVAAYLKKPKSLYYFSQLLFVAIALYASSSRTILVLAAMLFLCNSFFLLSGRLRMIFVITTLAALTATATIDNPIRQKLIDTFSDKGLDKHNEKYPDDRIAFWVAHWEMIKEKPLFGHGAHIDTQYRVPYYEKIGLGNLEKKYEAHNQFIQVLTNGGIVALALFLLWQFSLIWNLWKIRKVNFNANIAIQALIFFNLAALTQNAFQDSEVRYTLILMTVYIYHMLMKAESHKD